MKSLLQSLYFCLTLALSACGGASPVAAQSCPIPYEITVSRTFGGELTRTIKNSPWEAPYVAQTGQWAGRVQIDCPGTGTQWINTSILSYNYFSGAGDHIAILTRGTVDFNVPSYLGRGVAISAPYGIIGERMALNSGDLHSICQNASSAENGVICNANMQKVTPPVFSDGTLNYLSIQSSPGNIAFYTSDYSQAWHESFEHVSLQGSTIVIEVLCQGGCSDKEFSVTFTNNQAGWF